MLKMCQLSYVHSHVIVPEMTHFVIVLSLLVVHCGQMRTLKSAGHDGLRFFMHDVCGMFMLCLLANSLLAFPADARPLERLQDNKHPPH